MGADIRVRKPKNLTEHDIRLKCAHVPIDVEIHVSWLYFHYAYWGPEHELRCENFVANFVKKHKVKAGKWGY